MRLGWDEYKDASPRQTIDTIQAILDDLGVQLTCTHYRAARGLHSIRANLFDSIMGVNGKGTSILYAQASAYAELMERMQAQLIYSLYTYHMRPSALHSEGFFVAPDEVLATRASFRKMISPSLRRVVGRHLSAELIDDYFKLERLSGRTKAVLLPYSNAVTGEVELIPHNLHRILVASNGLAAGNTISEAIVQAISELIERFVNISLLAGTRKIMDIPRSIVRRYAPREASTISRLAKAGIDIDVFDASPFDDIPVVGILAQHRGTSKYLVKIGVHPKFAIALERCLTEFMQGYDNISERISDMISFDAQRSLHASHLVNTIDVLRNGLGHYPASFFSDRNSFVERPYFKKCYSSNADMMEASIKAIRNRFGAVLVRDMSFLGFPTVSVYVPSMSELLRGGMLRQVIRRELQDQWCATALKKVCRLQRRELMRLSRLIRGTRSLAFLLNLPITNRHPLANYSANLFCAAIHTALGSYEVAAAAASAFVDECDNNPDAALWARSLKDYLEFRHQGVSSHRALATCERWYGRSRIDHLHAFATESAVLRLLSPMPCWNCAKCPYAAGQCRYPRFERLHMQLKKRYALWHKKQAHPPQSPR